ncbi:MAG: AAA family ATPase [Patescibacteria group bacterium]|nr:AAA family ATPase [Patescibacteria group bacterium]MDD5164881.1 AAA family ATPase [Patescibacteria group bacterium]MDD5534661.1 AAA family ATPase [Patescibacteria group bacterium]
MKNNIAGKKIGSGLVFGKFMPLHEGHVYLLNFALKSCNKLTILVCSLKDEPIPGEIRFLWVKQLFPNANVIHHYADIPQEPKEDPDFWNIWKESIKKHCPGEEFDALFGSEDYGWKMAETMGIEYIPVNRQRDLVPISGTTIRKNPIKYWRFLPEITRPYFVKKVCIVGPESTGKTTLVKKLAKKYKTVFVDEYARQLLDEYVKHAGYKEGEVRYKDIFNIARGQIATEDSQVKRANKILFCDTDLNTTVFWSNFYFKKCPQWIKKEAENRIYDLYLLLDIDVPWVKDPQRPIPKINERKKYLKWWQEELKKQKRPYIIIKGNWEERLKLANQSINKLFVNSK